MIRNDFCVFILSHGRANNIKTLKSLKKANYTGKLYIVIDDQDETKDEYYKKYGDKVLEFSKEEIAKRFDVGDLCPDMRTIVYARNACFDLAEKVGCRYFLELDDDYTSFAFREIKGKKLRAINVKQADRLFNDMIDFLNESNALTVAFAQAGDFIGGADGGKYKQEILRKAMNTFFCDTQKRFDFVGRINEDVNTYTTLGQQGKLIMTVTFSSIVQTVTQKNKGGMSDTYLDMGTYLKSFFSVMYSPSCVKIAKMGSTHKRILHEVDWENCCPKIINERWKK